jgi:phage terminase small subunit
MFFFMTKKLTGKQKAFVNFYCGEANFVSNDAARKAGYKASTQHSFESIGSELLAKPHVKAAVDEYFRQANVSADEVLRELGQLARGSSKDKIRALSLLAAHHGLLDGSYWSRGGRENIEIIVKYETEKRLDDITRDIQKDVDAYNRKADEDNKRRDEQWEALIRKYDHSPITVTALRELRDVMFGKKQVDDIQPQPVEVEFIPPTRRLQPAAIERLMLDVPVPTEEGEYQIRFSSRA